MQCSICKLRAFLGEGIAKGLTISKATDFRLASVVPPPSVSLCLMIFHLSPLFTKLLGLVIRQGVLLLPPQSLRPEAR
jgi:hypothetical protein